MNPLIIIVVLGAFMWLFLIRPQRKRQMAQQKLLQGIEPGVEIVTAGGLFGQVIEVEDSEVRLEIAPGTIVRVAKRAVAAVIPPDEPEEPEALEAEAVEAPEERS
ncbi:MAG: preprotein translocase subunit YajC [Gaiellaceae bacterium]